MAAGLDFLLQYPYGCTEQQLSRARAYVALKKFRALLQRGRAPRQGPRTPSRTCWTGCRWWSTATAWCAYWPGSRGYVLAHRLGGRSSSSRRKAPASPSIQKLLRHADQLARAGAALRLQPLHRRRGLHRARLGAAPRWRTPGKFDPAYAAELARRAQYLDLEGDGAGARSPSCAAATPTPSTLDDLATEDVGRRRHPPLSGPRDLRRPAEGAPRAQRPDPAERDAHAGRGDARRQPHAQADAPRLQLLVDALVTLGRGDGWGSTNANASALLALAEVLKPPFAGSAAAAVCRCSFGGRPQGAGDRCRTHRSAQLASTSADAGELPLQGGAAAGVVVARAKPLHAARPTAARSPRRPTASSSARELLRVPKAGDAPPEHIPLGDPGTTVTFTRRRRRRGARAGGESRGPPLRRRRRAAGRRHGAAQSAARHRAARSQAARHADARAQLRRLPRRPASPSTTTRCPRGPSTSTSAPAPPPPAASSSPPAQAEMMYDGSVRGNSAGAWVEIGRE